MLSRFVIGGITLLAIASSFLGVDLSLGKKEFSHSLSKKNLSSHANQIPEKVFSIYQQITEDWESYRKETGGKWDPTILYSALEYASEKHKGQVRKDAASTPYIVHPMGVAKILWEEANVRDKEILIAAILHDTLENTSATEEEISGMFGARVLSIVKELTNDPRLSGQENKQRQIDHASFMSHEAKLVKLADRLYNIRDLRDDLPVNWSKEEIERYLSWGEKLLHALAGTDAQLEEALEWELTHTKNEKTTVMAKSLVL